MLLSGRTLAAAALAAAAAVLFGPGLTAPAAADPAEPERGIGIRLLDLPANNADDPRAQVYVVDQVDPGVTFSRRIEVINDTEAAVTVDLYAVASRIADEGGWVVGDGRGGNELTGWITLDPPSVELDPRSRQAVTATFAVPEDAAGGERYATLMAEPRPAEEGGIRQVSRVGIRTYLFVTGDTRPRYGLEVAAVRALVAEDGRWRVEAEVTSTGTRAMDVTATLTLDLPDGPVTAGPYENVPPALSLAPGATGTVAFDVGEPLSPSIWDAEVVAVSGDDAEAVGRARVDFAGEDGPVDRGCGLWCPVALGLLAVTVASHGRDVLARRRAAGPARPAA